MASPNRGGWRRLRVCPASYEEMPGVQRFPLADDVVERPHRLLKGCFRIGPVAVKDVDVLKAHPLQALVQAGDQVLARAQIPVGTRPHQSQPAFDEIIISSR